ncbi:TPA: type II toxin-antitoxin system RelE/ParE family toxin [Escherichia coli]
MELKWTSKALSDLARLYDFLVLASKPAAARTVQSLTQAPVILLTHPRMGEQLFQFEPREVRRIFAGEWICPYISRHLLSLNPLQARCRRYSRGER